MFDDLKKSLDSYKVASKLALRLGGPTVLALGSAKLVDALDCIVTNNFGCAAVDVWQATSNVLRLLVDTIPNIRTGVGSARLFVVAADDATINKQYMRAAENYLSALMSSAEANKYLEIINEHCH